MKTNKLESLYVLNAAELRPRVTFFRKGGHREYVISEDGAVRLCRALWHTTPDNCTITSLALSVWYDLRKVDTS